MSVLKRNPIALRRIVADVKNFDWEIYLLNYPELVNKGIKTKEDAINHYKKIGFFENRSFKITGNFDAEKYLKEHASIGLKTPRDAYIHSKRVSSLKKRNEDFKRNLQAYRVPIASQNRKIVNNKAFIKQNNPPTQIHQPPQPQQPRRIVQPFAIRQANSRLNPKNNIVPSIFTMNARRLVKQPKPGQLVLHEPPSSYFGKRGLLGPPKYLN